MKLSAWIAGSLVAAATLIGACSSAPSQPKIDTKGDPTVGSGGGSMGGGASGDGGTVAPGTSDDGGTITVVADAGSCTSGGCSGCCDNLGVCHAGNQNAYCGLSSQICLSCPAPTSCSGNQCQ